MIRSQGNIFSDEKKENHVFKNLIQGHYSEPFKTEAYILEIYIYLLVSVED